MDVDFLSVERLVRMFSICLIDGCLMLTYYVLCGWLVLSNR